MIGRILCLFGRHEWAWAYTGWIGCRCVRCGKERPMGLASRINGLKCIQGPKDGKYANMHEIALGPVSFNLLVQYAVGGGMAHITAALHLWHHVFTVLLFGQGKRFRHWEQTDGVYCHVWRLWGFTKNPISSKPSLRCGRVK